MAESLYNQRQNKGTQSSSSIGTTNCEPLSAQGLPVNFIEKECNINSFVPPSIEMVSGKSVMGEEESYCPPLVPPAAAFSKTAESPNDVAGYLKNYVGKKIRAQFIIGTGGTLIDRAGILIDVGASFFVIQPEESDNMLICDLNTMRFVTIYR